MSVMVVALAVLLGAPSSPPAGPSLAPSHGASQGSSPTGASAPSAAGIATGDMGALTQWKPLTFAPNTGEGALLAKTRGLAVPLMFVAFIFGLIAELLMAEEARYGVVLRRLLLAAFVLMFYNGTVGSVVEGLRELGVRVAPVGGLIESYQVQTAQARAAATLRTEMETGGGLAATVGLAFADAGMWVLLFILTAIVIVLVMVGHVMVGVMYVIGPLALAFSVPRGSATAKLWFKELVTYACWPLFIGIFLSLVAGMGASGLSLSGALGSLIAAILGAAAALTVPKTAATLVGGSLGNAAAFATDLAAKGATVAATGGAGAAVGAAADKVTSALGKGTRESRALEAEAGRRVAVDEAVQRRRSESGSASSSPP